MVTGSVQEEELTILNICAPSTGAPRYIKQVLNDLQRDLDSHTIVISFEDIIMKIWGLNFKKRIMLKNRGWRDGPRSFNQCK